MYRAKAAGKGRVELYAPQMQPDVVRKAELATRLRAALHDGEFALLHQPVVSLDSGRIASVSAQARWRSSQGVLFTPAEFLRAAEDGDAHRRAGPLDAGGGRRAGRRARPPRASPCPSPSGCSARRLLDRVAAPRLRRGPADPARAALRRPGHRAGRHRPPGPPGRAGTPARPRCAGSASGSRWTASAAATRPSRRCGRLPVDVLKLDRGLVEGVVESARLHKITSGLLRIAGDLGLQSVADGVDLPEQVVALRAMGCTHGQGMAFSGPLDEYRLRRALASGHYPVPQRSGRARVRGRRRGGVHSGVPASSEADGPPLT